MGCHNIGKHLVLGSWNTVTLHESLGEGFGALELRSLTGRAKDPQIQQPEPTNHECHGDAPNMAPTPSVMRLQ